MERLSNMRSRIESLSNQTFRDVTAWRAVRNADRKGTERKTGHADVLSNRLNSQTDFITIYQRLQEPKTKLVQPNRIAQLNEQLTNLHKLKKEGHVVTKEQKAQYRMLRTQYKAELHEEMEKRGHM